jgi:pyroglutamyl-peptidase
VRARQGEHNVFDAVAPGKVSAKLGRAMRILVTGFEPFGGNAGNPSMEVVHALPESPDLLKRILPVVYADSAQIIRDVIRVEQPDAVLSLGLCGRSSGILLERLAVNVNDDTCGDNAGDSARGRLIDSAGPVGYWSTLPLTAMHCELREKGIPAAWSNHAGTYVCNHIFYTACRAMEELGGDRPCGFVHLPRTGDGGLPLATLIETVEICLDVIRANAAAK